MKKPSVPSLFGTNAAAGGGMAEPSVERSVAEDDVDSGSGLRPAARVIESAVELARAEATLALARAQIFGVHAVSALLWTIAAVCLAGVALVLTALSGVVLRFSSGVELALGLGGAVATAAVCVVQAFRSYRRLTAGSTR